MKLNLYLFPSLLVLGFSCLANVKAQMIEHPTTTLDRALDNTSVNVGVDERNIQSFKIPYTKTTHIISPEPISYVDISSPAIEGDLPEKNVFRLRPRTSSTEAGPKIGLEEDFTVTVVSENYITVYKLAFNPVETSITNKDATQFILVIDPSRSIQVNANSKITPQDFDKLCLTAIRKRRRIYDVHARENGMGLWLNNVYVFGDYIMLDVRARNYTKLKYDVNSVEFKLIDSRRVGATVSQEIELRPIYQFEKEDRTQIRRKWHNFYIFRKFTYPVKKKLEVRLTERQISGRPIAIEVNYQKILQSQTLLSEE